MAGCILSKFYIKPQPRHEDHKRADRCILSKFYIKPQPADEGMWMLPCCILSKFYIKPQLRLERELAYCVVSYRNSTSNHNPVGHTSAHFVVVSYRNSTSNHNHYYVFFPVRLLYLIEILHQTTTCHRSRFLCCWLYLIEILHQTTT